ncbi:migration and invasion-inhibitory protein isoform X2 [Kryptolebias marmoratus]|uniref:migration and invasion-inhibitory protein isoform X2 n=1 Tax=Kryptolebias marmoratus TaxID=37003 RepID=UPI000D52FD99|nr:migration and invasion-inhibitory protein isoform X2 [Kryptolebias marmoratus]
MSADRLEVLRERNRRLLTQLSGCSGSRKRGREAEVTVTRTEGGRGPARAALAKPSVRFADTLETHKVSTPSGTSKHRGVTADSTTLSDPLNDNYKNLQTGNKLQDSRLKTTKTCQREAKGRVTFQSDEGEAAPASFSRRLQPLLGYDWIAGVLDTEDSLVERSDDFFDDLRVFRTLNKDECSHDAQAELFEERRLVTPLRTDNDDQGANTNSHQCTFSYRINSRLFPVPLHSQECCPVCKKPKSSHPHSAAEPALIRVSIPRSALSPPYKYKAHRRSSFDPSDSLGLPSHCLSGWSNTGQNVLPPPSSLDLRSSLRTTDSDSLLNEEPEAQQLQSHSHLSFCLWILERLIV